MGYELLLNMIQNGDPVSAETLNRTFRELDGNLGFLLDLVMASGVGSTVSVDGLPVEAAANVGVPVWYNPTTAQFERGLAAAVFDTQAGQLQTAPTALVWGVVKSKSGPTIARITLFGYDTIDLTASAGAAAPPAGLYYLSGLTPGGLTRTAPAVAVPVLRCDGGGRVFVSPQIVDVNSAHRHYRVPLVCLPAGDHTPPTPGERHTISNPDVTRSGWLPASHASFLGLAPAGALFGYNLAADPTLSALWPPLPLAGTYLEWDRGGDYTQGAQGVPLGPKGLCVVDRNGIWWLSDCWKDVPWPYYLTTAGGVVGSIGSTGSLSGDEPTCPRDPLMALTLWFTRVTFLTEGAAVTSLVSPDKRIKITCQGGTTSAATGPLALALDLSAIVTPGAVRGATVLKTVDGNLNFQQGVVTEGVYTTSPNVTLSSNLPYAYLTPGDTGSPKVYQGLVRVEVATAPTLELPPLLVRLHSATEEFYKGALYLGLNSASASQFVAEFSVPSDVPSSYQMTLRLRVLGRAAGQLPQLSVAYQRVGRPASGLSAPVALAAGTTTLTCVTTGTLSAPDQYVEATSSPFAVAPGDLVFFTVTRNAPDGYAAQVGILTATAVLSSS